MSIDCVVVMLLTQLGPLFLGHTRIWLRLGLEVLQRSTIIHIQDEHSFLFHF